REYAAEQLHVHDDVDAWRRRHAEHYTAFAEEAGPALTGADELAWRLRRHAEDDNLRAAVTWSVDSNDTVDGELAVRIVAALAQESIYEPVSGVATWAERAAEHARQSRPGLRAAVLGAAAWGALFGHGDVALCLEITREALDDGVPADCPAPHVAIAAQIVALGQTGRFDEAERAWQKARRELERVGANPFSRHFVDNCVLFTRA